MYYPSPPTPDIGTTPALLQKMLKVFKKQLGQEVAWLPPDGFLGRSYNLRGVAETFFVSMPPRRQDSITQCYCNAFILDGMVCLALQHPINSYESSLWGVFATPLTKKLAEKIKFRNRFNDIPVTAEALPPDPRFPNHHAIQFCETATIERQQVLITGNGTIPMPAYNQYSHSNPVPISVCLFKDIDGVHLEKLLKQIEAINLRKGLIAAECHELHETASHNKTTARKPAL